MNNELSAPKVDWHEPRGRGTVTTEPKGYVKKGGFKKRDEIVSEIPDPLRRIESEVLLQCTVKSRSL